MYKTIVQNHLTSRQINEIYNLSDKCDRYVPYIDEQSVDGNDCFYLCYDNNTQELIAFLSFLIVNHEAEVTAMTDPMYQNQKIFTNLLLSATKYLNTLGITKLYAALPADLSKCSFCKEQLNTEYLMCLNKEDYLSYGMLMNNTENDTASDVRFDKVSDSEYFIFCNNENIGVCKFDFQGDFTNLHSVEIKKPYRSNGYGFALISYAINEYFCNYDNPLILHVSGSNNAACKLYRKCNFQIIESVTYYAITSLMS